MVLNTLRAPNLQHKLCPLEYAHKSNFSIPPCMRRGQQLTSPVDSKQVQPKIDRWKRQTEAHWRFSALLNNDDVVRSISLPHSPLQKELEIVEVLRIGVGEDVDHKRLGPLLLLGLGGPKPLWGPTGFSCSVRLRRLLWLAAVASGYGGQGQAPARSSARTSCKRLLRIRLPRALRYLALMSSCCGSSLQPGARASVL